MTKPKPLTAKPPSGETVYEERRFLVRKCAIPLSDGSSESRALMIHPGAVVLVPILADGRIVMIRNTRWQVGQTLLELPAGTREVNEAPQHCAARELREETGYRADNLQPLQSFFAAPGVSTEIMHPYVATGLQFVGQALAPDEQIETVIMTKADLIGAIQNGEIIDGKTLAVLGAYLLR